MAFYHAACVRCGRNEKGLPAPPSEVPWRCSQDGHVNNAHHLHCGKVVADNFGQGVKCWAEKRLAALRTGGDFRANDWICPECSHDTKKSMTNFAREVECRWCGKNKYDLEKAGWLMEHVRDFPTGTKFDSDRS